MNLAFYGTLRDPDVLRLVTGDALAAAFHKSVTVQGWACLRIEGEAYPLLRSEPGTSTQFHLYHDCSEVSWRRLVAYEGQEYGYQILTIEGQAYRVFMADPSVQASEDVWDLESFQAYYKDGFLAQLLAEPEFIGAETDLCHEAFAGPSSSH